LSAAGISQSYAIDGLGNLLGQNSFDTGVLSNSYTGSQNQLTSSSLDSDYAASLGLGSDRVTFGYDSNGNLVSLSTDSVRSFTYDAWNRQVSAGDVTYSYDALGRRITITADDTTTNLSYSNQWQVLEERSTM